MTHPASSSWLRPLHGLLRFPTRLWQRGPAFPAFPAWPRWWPVRCLRAVLVRGLLVPLLRLGYRIEVEGAGNIEAGAAPCLVVSNHNMHLDWGMLLCAMPAKFRRRVMVGAAATDIFGNPIRRFGAQVVGNAFPFAKEGSGIRESLEFVSAMLHDGWNVLIFPEGKLTTTGPTQAFKPGIGWLVVRTGADVLPMRVDVLRPGLYEGKWLPHPRGHVRVTIGKPVRPDPAAPYADVATALERAVAEA